MAKRHDHLERARREEERLLLNLAWEKQQEQDKLAHAEQGAQLKIQMKEGRAHDLAEKKRFARMSAAVGIFQGRVLEGRQGAHQAAVAQWRLEQEKRREELRLEKERLAAEAKAHEEMIEAARREAEEEEARRIQEVGAPH